MYRDCLLKVLGINSTQVEKIVSKGGEIRVDIREPLEGCCPECNRRSRDRKTVRRRKLKGLGLLGMQVTVILPHRVFYCRNDECPKKTFVCTAAPELKGRGGLLPAACELIRTLVLELHLNNQDAVRVAHALFGLRTSEVNVRRVLDDKRVRVPSGYAPKRLGIDERFPKGNRRKGRTQRKKAGQLVLVDLDRGVAIASVRGIDAKAARRLFRIARRRADLSQVETITRDLCRTWDDVILEELSQQITIGVDDFHLVRAVFRQIYGKAYVAERQRLRREGQHAKARQLFVNRYRFLKRRRRLRKDDKRNHTRKLAKLDAVLGKHPRLRQLYRFKERFLALLDRSLSPPDFQQELIHLIERAERLKLHALAKLLIEHSPFICDARRQPAPRFHPEQCHALFRHVERRRKSFRTDRSRERHERAMLVQALKKERAA